MKTAMFLCACVGLAASAAADTGLMSAFVARYPTSTLPARMATLTGSQCNVCHHPPNRSTPGNCYRTAITVKLGLGMSAAEALQALDAEDSDGDGVRNGVEITTARAGQPGQIGYNPGLVGAVGTDPCGSAGAITNQPETPPCYANCDNSTVAPILNVQDFSCFLNRFASADTWANCDGSTVAPVLNVQDFSCFLNRFATGCS